MKDFFDGVFNVLDSRKYPIMKKGFRTPLSDIRETETKVIATFELPGADKGEIDLNVTEDTIEIKVSKKAEKEVKDKNKYSYEARSSQFYRALPLPTTVKAHQAKATYKNGILNIEIPKEKVEKKKKKITIK